MTHCNSPCSAVSTLPNYLPIFSIPTTLIMDTPSPLPHRVGGEGGGVQCPTESVFFKEQNRIKVFFCHLLVTQAMFFTSIELVSLVGL